MIKVVCVLAALALSCSKNEVVDVVEPTEPVQVIEETPKPCIVIETFPAKDSQETATLELDFPGMCVEVRHGEVARRLESDESLTVTTDGRELQRIVIGETPLLMRLAPGSTQRIAAHPDHGWQLEGERFTNPSPSLVELVLPSAWTKAVRYMMPGEDSARSMPGPIDPPLEVTAQTAQLLRVDTGAEVVGVAVGAGEHWVLRVTPGGKLFGSAKDR